MNSLFLAVAAFLFFLGAAMYIVAGYIFIISPAPFFNQISSVLVLVLVFMSFGAISISTIFTSKCGMESGLRTLNKYAISLVSASVVVLLVWAVGLLVYSWVKHA